MELKDWLAEGQTTFSNVVIRSLKDLGLSPTEFTILLYIKSYQDRGEKVPQLSTMAQALNMTDQDLYQAINQLLQKKNLSMESALDEEGKQYDRYSFDSLYEKLQVYSDRQVEAQEQQEETNAVGQLLAKIEQEFGRPLSAIEIETIDHWFKDDGYTPEMVDLALRESVLSQVYNLRYMDRILMNWDKKNLRSKSQIEASSQSYREKRWEQEDHGEEKPSKAVPIFRWIDNDVEGED